MVYIFKRMVWGDVYSGLVITAGWLFSRPSSKPACGKEYAEMGYESNSTLILGYISSI